MDNLKNIQIGPYILQRVKECDICMERICSFLKCKENDVLEMYKAESMDTNTLLRWSKLLEYDFFRLYSNHLILYAPQANAQNYSVTRITALPQFRKNLYTQGVILFILELIKTEAKTKQQIIDEYKIPKTTLYKWITKYGDQQK